MPSAARLLKQALVRRARELGFDDCRCTTADPPDHRAALRQWLANGEHGTMEYLERNAAKRADLGLVLPGARSVVCVAASYAVAVEKTGGATANREAGFIARYARAADYHDLLGARLRELTRHLDSLAGPGTRSLWYIDTGPILERDLAQRAGLGFIGKHTNLVSRRWGNWIFLGEILTTAELEIDVAEPNRCGRCTRCLDSCPTGALVAPFRLDARLCIAYLTIELRGPIPSHLRAAIGNRIFGCDDCLAACPWNRFAAESAWLREHRREDLTALKLISLLELDEPGFRTRFGSTPLARVRRRGLLRNVCVALGNTAGVEALPALERAARDAEPLISEHALWAISQITARARGNHAAAEG